MTLATTDNRIQYAGNGVVTSFTIPFEFPADADIIAVLTDVAGVDTVWVLNTQYTLVGQGNPLGGSLEVETTPTDYTPATGETLTIYREVALTQNSDFSENDPLPAESLEDTFDIIVMMVQQLQEQIDRTLKLPVTSSSSDLQVPEPEALKVLAWNAAADALENGPTTADIINAAANAAAAASSASAAAASASAASTSESNAAASASAASTAQTAAETAQTATELAADFIDDLYLGAKAAEPTLDNDGNALQDGALFFNTTTNELGIYDLGATTWVYPVVEAETAESNAASSASSASSSASSASSSASTASTAATNAAAAQTAAENAQSYAEEWANKAEDSLISSAAGGDQVDDYSALHWANKAAASATAAETFATKVNATTTNPTVNDDVDLDYEPGSLWINTTTDEIFICVDATDGAAIWTSVNRHFLAFRLVKHDTDCAIATNLIGKFVMPFSGRFIQDDNAKNLFYAETDANGVTGTMVVDIHLNGTTIMSTNKLDIETNEAGTQTAATQPDLTTTTFSAGDELTFEIDAVHTGTAAKGCVVGITVIRDN